MRPRLTATRSAELASSTAAGKKECPWISLNMAMTADGKIATATRSISSFGSQSDQKHLYALRAQSDAVMTGAGTLRSENADLGTGGKTYRCLRRRNGLSGEGLRVIVTRQAKLESSLRIFSEAGGPLIILTTQKAPLRNIRALERLGAVVERFGTHDVDLQAATEWLATRWKARRIHCEGGSELNQSLLTAGLIDEIHVTWCPLIFGGNQAPTLADGIGFGSLNRAAQFHLAAVQKKGKELFLRFTRQPQE